MEFWEGAVLVVGGIWLVGRMSRQSPAHPINAMAPVNTLSGTDHSGGLNPTLVTNQAGDGSLTAGEPIGLPAPPLLHAVSAPKATPAPCSTCFGINTKPFRPDIGQNFAMPRSAMPSTPPRRISLGTTTPPVRGAGASGGSVVNFGGVQPSPKVRLFAV